MLPTADGYSVTGTRAGNFSFDKSGKLMSTDGQYVQGYTQVNPATGAIVTTGQPTDITVPPGVLIGGIVGVSLTTEWWLPPPERRILIGPTRDGVRLGMQIAW